MACQQQVLLLAIGRGVQVSGKNRKETYKMETHTARMKMTCNVQKDEKNLI